MHRASFSARAYPSSTSRNASEHLQAQRLQKDGESVMQYDEAGPFGCLSMATVLLRPGCGVSTETYRQGPFGL